ncbi:CopY/TcrY family copper transport repressor [Alkalibacterium sp. 20]|uniref:CopY/TcrY family copper transport repressor n=1 Tax=Alkalibacterium sp. 20 TaxID=1798803 RepID=UPI0009004088|nr:CopY/TcrY family copper transport repressor [Alkalibacterium sp. 20]OJF90176.1 penicillinase repressor [Alkalibacterium sp. 20]
MNIKAVPPHITDAEWEVMRVVWANKHVTSKEVILILESKMNWKQTTVKTLLGRLVEKGVLDTEQDGRKYIYKTKFEEMVFIKDYANNLFQRICKKDIGHVIEDIIKEQTLSFNDIKKIEETLMNKKELAISEVDCQCISGQCECSLHQHGEKPKSAG